MLKRNDARADKSNFVGKTVPRENARRLSQGRGRYVDDIAFRNLAHVAFVRSPHAHARILSIDTQAARAVPGVIDVITGQDIRSMCQPWVGVLGHFPGLKSAEQYPLAVDVARWHGEPVAVVLAESRALAEDGADLIEVEWEALPSVVDPETALESDAHVIHPELGDNLAFRLDLEKGEVDAAFASAAHIAEGTFHFGRHTGLTLEPRSIVADFDPALRQLTVHHSTQTPFQMQDVFARHFGLEEGSVRVIAPDVGGSFGLKLHVYGEEMAACALSIRHGRPVKFIADRLEAFQTDIHARDHRVKARMAVSAEGEILAMEVDDLTGIGPFSVYPRTSAVEGNQAIRLMGGPYRMPSYRGRLQVVFQNKTPMCQYRAVGHPVACAVTEGLVDQAAHALGIDPLEMRRRNVVTQDMYPHTSPTGYVFERLSHEECHARLAEMMNYERLRREQAEARERGVYRGIGFATFIEITNPGPAFYGVGGARISAQDGCVMKMEPSGDIRVMVSVTEQGQGTETIMAQIAATHLGVPLERVRVYTGDTQTSPYGGATWASRGAGIGGVAVMKTAEALKENLLTVAATILQAQPGELDISAGAVVSRASGEERMPLSELGRIAYFRPDTLPAGFHAELTAARHYVPQGYPFAFTNGVQASHLEVDIETGQVRLLDHWVVEDCGRIINPLLVDEQIRGGVVQGLGGALFEECLYSPEGQLLCGTMADYLTPMAAEMPDIHVGHVETPTETSPLGAKGVGEAGTAAAPAAVMNAINDALSPFGASVSRMPFTPERVLRALGKV
ncbi:carbon-monoxide dehydrogenase large subunit, coxL-like protein [Nitratireductor indicus C115]|uniref:Carbon-monoxide dehydrogenase large subunit, coxL-like protein n=1 Tax=Nitratireductor indicus C115 TaxID=1231190 RepID=K2NPY9_9HYPH|nr:xanthine dehydrogenase family protein molybdopterin-binding subunit [Nitratireductor indicus]EKF41425.1 carbon-monoxide dehydrogenase large subunit, coxL-like protein [Nitratireductor indicus C115]SFQ71966.1 carbon-monoxide dehydrogenase large subunit [Nitratireductor indicus]